MSTSRFGRPRETIPGAGSKKGLDTTAYENLTEVTGHEVSEEQLQRMVNRYAWASQRVGRGDVLEVAAGSGSGLGLLRDARRVVASDLSLNLLRVARSEYGSAAEFVQLEGGRLPFKQATFDFVMLFEAIYYLPDAAAFAAEAARVLRPGGELLVVSANKDLFDFTPSPHSFAYYGVPELASLLHRAGFAAEFFGDTPVQETSLRQKALRPAKMIASRLGVIPRTMRGRKLLRRLMYGNLQRLPPNLATLGRPPVAPQPLPANSPDRVHKVLYCAAKRIAGR
jgi:SAM-dependent methyltransferase